jgi:hypothetical protein
LTNTIIIIDYIDIIERSDEEDNLPGKGNIPDNSPIIIPSLEKGGGRGEVYAKKSHEFKVY